MKNFNLFEKKLPKAKNNASFHVGFTAIIKKSLNVRLVRLFGRSKKNSILYHLWCKACIFQIMWRTMNIMFGRYELFSDVHSVVIIEDKSKF